MSATDLSQLIRRSLNAAVLAAGLDGVDWLLPVHLRKHLSRERLPKLDEREEPCPANGTATAARNFAEASEIVLPICYLQ